MTIIYIYYCGQESLRRNGVAIIVNKSEIDVFLELSCFLHDPRVNVDILEISELKWTGMGEFNSDDHYIYYCGQESLRRNGVAIMVNKRV